MFKTILYPTDFSEVAAKALDYIKQLKEAGSQKVIVLHVFDERGLQAVKGYFPTQFPELIQNRIEDITKQLKKVEKELADSGFSVEARIQKGIPFREILQAEEKESISVIVIGSHGRSNLEEVFLGSVSDKVARKSKSPVLIIKR